MAAADNSVIAALKTIESAELSPNDNFLLSRFVQESLAPAEAARYILDRISQNSKTESQEDALLSIKRELESLALKVNRDDHKVPRELDAAVRRRENHHCCVTGEKDGLQSTYIIPPSILDDDDLRPGGYLRRLLESSISTKAVSQLESFLNSQSKEEELKNIWLLSASARHDFRNGHLEIRRAPFYGGVDFHIEEEKPEKEWRIDKTVPLQSVLDTRRFNPRTPDSGRLPLPKRSLFRIHYIVSLPLHFRAIERETCKAWPTTKQDAALGSTGISLLRGFIRLVPAFIRIALYRYIIKTVPYSGPMHRGTASVRLLPLGLCLKEGRPTTSKNEANALLLVEKHTETPAPRLVDFQMKGEETGFMLMTQVPGDRLDEVLYRMTHEERKQLGRDLGKSITQWRQISNDSPYQVSNTIGGPIYDNRLEDKQCGPFDSLTDFTDYLTKYFEDRRQEPPLSALYKQTHQIYFTHSDLHRTNIFVQGGKLSGIIDWEHAGFKPEYWEYTKALCAYWACKEQKDLFSQTFTEDYEEELAAELFLWRAGPMI